MTRKGKILLRTDRISNVERLFITVMAITRVEWVRREAWRVRIGCLPSERRGTLPLSLTSVYASLVFAHSWPVSRDFLRMGLLSLFSAVLLEAVNMFMDNVSLLPFKSHSGSPTSLW